MTGRRAYRYRVVDVFTECPLEGNPLAVFPEAPGIDEGTMQRIARELNLSETTFVGPATRADCAVAVRIFTPTRELPFAGHPTIGTAFVLLDEGIAAGTGRPLVLEEKIGPVAVRVDEGERPLLWLRTPPMSFGRAFEPALCAEVLGLDPRDLLEAPPQLVSAGNPTLFVAVRDGDAVDRTWLDARGSARLRGERGEAMCVFVFAPTAAGGYSRMFAPDYGIAEDPATGSSTGPLAAFMLSHRLAPGARFISEQGTKMGRRSILHVQIHGKRGEAGIDVGGHAVPIADATMTL